MTTAGRAIINSLGPIHRNLGLPVTTKPATAVGVFNSTIAASNTAEKVVSAWEAGKRARRVLIYNPGAGHLAFTTIANGSGVTPTTMTATAAGGDLDGSAVPSGGQVEVILPFNAELWLAASANGARYQLVITENA